MTKRNLAVLIVVAACVLAGTAVAAADNGDPGVPITNETDTADGAYVTDDGSVIVVSQSEGAAGTGELGMNVTEGLVYGSYHEPVETNVTGEFAMAANKSQVNASGSLAMPRPENLQSLDATIESTTNAENSRSDMDLEATVALPEDSSALTMLFDEFTTTGTATTSGSALEMQGSANWSAALGMDAQEHSFDLRATEKGHVLEASQSYNVSSFAAEQWNTREKATESLEGQFSMVAQMVNGSSNLTMDAYDFESTEDGGHLDVEYTVELQGIHQFLQQGLAESLSESPQFGDSMNDLDVELDDVSIDRVSVSVDVNQGSGSASWDVAVDGYDQLMLAYMDVMEATDDSGMIANQSDRLEAQFAAMQSANYSQTGSWDIAVSTTTDGAIQADASMEQRTDNWQAYVAERDARDLPAVGTQRFAFDAATEADQVVMNGSFLVQREDMYGQTLQSLERSFEQSSSVAGTPDINPFARLNAADFVGSRLDASVNETAVAMDGHAEFGNLSALTSLMDEQMDAGSMEQIYVDAEGDSATTYVRLENVVESDSPDKTTLREHEMISDETNIYLPGEWDTETQSVTVPDSSAETSMALPVANDDAQQSDDEMTDDETSESSSTDEPTDQSSEDDTETTDEPTETTTSTGPGFGVVVAVVATLAVAMIGLRRH
ncbi:MULTISPECIES: PGF-CTERM sorting domain-containing protein [unclassified Halorhabdus]|uniref:PGF-CTERM sorting domain-containing protein n=1 Tax=unclassified Halorhabdus TaxID=2621901 RepID=UPI0023DC22FB|nr:MULTISPECIES: PGF-CTERM sorting domain-containing protein [unclassified Halorhabdus]